MEIVQPKPWSHLSCSPEIASPGFVSRMAKEIKRPLESLQKFPTGQDKYIHTGTIPNVRLKGRVKPIVSAHFSNTTPLLPLSGSKFSSGFLASSNRMHELSSVVSDIETPPSVTEIIKDPTSVQAVVAALQQTQSAKTGIKRFRYMEPDEANKKQKVTSPIVQSNDNIRQTLSVNSTLNHISEKRALDQSPNGSLEGCTISPENKRKCIPDPRQASLSSAKNAHSRRDKISGRDTPFSLYDSQAGSDDSESNKSMYSHHSEQSLRDQVIENSFRIPSDQSGSLTPASTRGSVPSGVTTQCSSRTTTPTRPSQAINLENYRADKAKNRQRLSKMLGMLFNTSDDEETAGVSEAALNSINKLTDNDDDHDLTGGLEEKESQSVKLSSNSSFKLNLLNSSENKRMNGPETSSGSESLNFKFTSPAVTSVCEVAKTTNTLDSCFKGKALSPTIISSCVPIVTSSINVLADKSEISGSFLKEAISTTIVNNPSVSSKSPFNTPVSTLTSGAVYNPLLAGFKTTSVESSSPISSALLAHPISTVPSSADNPNTVNLRFTTNLDTLNKSSIDQNLSSVISKPSLIQSKNDTNSTPNFSFVSKANENKALDPFLFGSNLNGNKSQSQTLQSQSMEKQENKSSSPLMFNSAPISTTISSATNALKVTQPIATASGESSTALATTTPSFGFVSNFYPSSTSNPIQSTSSNISPFASIQLPSDTNKSPKLTESTNIFSFGMKPQNSSSINIVSESSIGVPKFSITTSAVNSSESSKPLLFKPSAEGKSMFSFSSLTPTESKDTLSGTKPSLFTFNTNENKASIETSTGSTLFGGNTPSSFGVATVSPFTKSNSTSTNSGKNTFDIFATKNTVENQSITSFAKVSSTADSNFTFSSVKPSNQFSNATTVTSQFGSGSSSSPFQFGGSTVPQFGAISEASSQFGTTAVINTKSTPQFSNTFGSSGTTPQFGGSSVTSQFGISTGTPQFGSSSGAKSPFSNSLKMPQFGSSPGTTPQFVSSSVTKPQFGGTTGTKQQFGGTTGTTAQFGSTTEKTSQFGNATGNTPQFGSTTGNTPQFGSTTGSTQFGSNAGTPTIPQFGAMNGGIPQFGAGTSSTIPQFGSSNVANQLFGSTSTQPFSSEGFNFGNNSVGAGSSNLFSFGTGGAGSSSIARRPRTRTARRK